MCQSLEKVFLNKVSQMPPEVSRVTRKFDCTAVLSCHLRFFFQSGENVNCKAFVTTGTRNSSSIETTSWKASQSCRSQFPIEANHCCTRNLFSACTCAEERSSPTTNVDREQCRFHTKLDVWWKRVHPGDRHPSFSRPWGGSSWSCDKGEVDSCGS